MAAGALFLTLWSRLRDDRLADKMGAGGLTEVHDLPAFSLERRVGRQTDGTGQDSQGPTFSGKREPLGAHSGSAPSTPDHRSPR